MRVAETNAYRRYLNDGVRLPDDHFPALEKNSSGEVILAPSEVYCRFRRANGELCFKDQQFSSPSNLRAHYQRVHKVTIEPARPGAISLEEIEKSEKFFAAIANNPRKARGQAGAIAVLQGPQGPKGPKGNKGAVVVPSDIEHEEDVDDREYAAAAAAEEEEEEEEEEERYNSDDDTTRPHEDLFCVPRRKDGVRDRTRMLANAGRKAWRVCSPCLVAQRTRCPPRRRYDDCKVWQVHHGQ